MAGFVVTSPTNTITLDPERRGEATFTVTNGTGHRVRAGASVVAFAPTAIDWLRLEEPIARDFDVGGTHQFAVRVILPAEAPAGRYSFRLDVASVAVPDEEWGHGPVMVFEAQPPPKPPPPPPEPAGYLETLAGALAGAVPLGLIGFAIGVTLGRQEPPPSSGNFLADLFGLIIYAIVLGAGGALTALLLAWIGAVVGAAVLLRARGFQDVGRTVLPMAILLPVLAVIILPIALQIADALNGPLETIIGFLALMLVVTLAALAGRGYARWRRTGHL